MHYLLYGVIRKSGLYGNLAVIFPNFDYYWSVWIWQLKPTYTNTVTVLSMSFVAKRFCALHTRLFQNANLQR